MFTNDLDGFSSVKIEKLKCIINYFRRVLKKTPKGVISFERRSLSHDEIPNWLYSRKKLTKLKVLEKGLIEKQGVGMLQVDFANKLIGGGILGNGCVQEEIRFAICPELIISRLFTEKLLENEVLFIKGCEQFNAYSGYGQSFRWASDFEETLQVDEWGRHRTKLVAMDALKFPHEKKHIQYHIEMIQRELTKSYCGFMERRQCDPKHKTAIASGNWGCGAFNGDSKLKAIIQLMSASQSDRDLLLFTFNDNLLKMDLENFYKFISCNGFTVGHLYKALLLFDQNVKRLQDVKPFKPDLFKFIIDSKEIIINSCK